MRTSLEFMGGALSVDREITMIKIWNLFKSSGKDYLFILLGTAAQAVALRLFLVPANLASGGVSGIAQIIYHYTGWSIGWMVLIGNLPLFLLGWRFLGGRKFALRTAWAIVTYSFLVEFVVRFIPANGITDDIFLNALYGAVASGVGYGLVYRGQGTSGGSDILVRILNYWRSIPVSQSYLMTDATVILAAGFVFGWKEALYAIITLYVSGIVAETVTEGSGVVRTAMIITGAPQIVAEKIIGDMKRGVTVMNATGAYTGAERAVLYCVITRSEVMQLKSIVHAADPAAFMVIGQAHEALGEGFAPFKKI
jgi:uncharacterized membrane-anchored protein YitT (DUF2179 family)